MKKRLFHRGHNIENTTGEPNGWRTVINGRPVENKLTLVKKSIDWWCDMKAFMPPEKFEGLNAQSQQAGQKVEEYRGFKLVNDSGNPNEWYVILRGRLLKGSPAAIKKHLDAVIEKLKQK